MGDGSASTTSPGVITERSGRDIDVVYTGLRTGEKLHEELLGDGEPDGGPTTS